jgi:hypothetical protein
VFAINDPDQVDEGGMKKLERSNDVKLMIVGGESGQRTGTVHFQGFLIFKKKPVKTASRTTTGWKSMAGHGTMNNITSSRLLPKRRESDLVSHGVMTSDCDNNIFNISAGGVHHTQYNTIARFKIAGETRAQSNRSFCGTRHPS